MSRGVALDRDERLVGRRPVERELQPPTPKEWHTFEEHGYRTLLVHRGVVLDLLAGWTGGGASSAQHEAMRAAMRLKIEPHLVPTPLAIIVVRRDRTYERLYIGDGRHPLHTDKVVPLYEDRYVNFKITSTTIIWSTHPEEYVVGQPVSEDILTSPHFTE